MTRAIYFDMDGTLADFYGVDGWLECLMNGDATPYEIAKPLFNFSALARQIHRLQNLGYHVGIITWLAKTSTKEFDEAVTMAKMKWLRKHLPSVEFDDIKVLAYGTPKFEFGEGILFDDERPNRSAWNIANDVNMAFDVNDILTVLRSLV